MYLGILVPFLINILYLFADFFIKKKKRKSTIEEQEHRTKTNHCTLFYCFLLFVWEWRQSPQRIENDAHKICSLPYGDIMGLCVDQGTRPEPIGPCKFLLELNLMSW